MYAEVCRTFRWADSLSELGWTPTAEVDLGKTIADRHAGSGRLALSWFGKDGSRRKYTFDQFPKTETGKIQRFLLRQRR
jgi:hypothetical protein